MLDPETAAELRFASSESQADDWRLCLISDGIEARVEWTEAGWAVITEPEHRARAAQTIDEYEAEQRDRRAAAARPMPPDQQSHLGVLAAVVFAVAHAITLLDRAYFLKLGAADAVKIQHGELWRVVTALFLHGDYMHVFSNSVAALILFTALGRWLGTLRAAGLILASGALGNLINAYVHVRGFSSIGASTATFSAIGLLAVLQWTRKDRRMKRYWPPLAAALGLFAMLGTGKETDVLAHLFGLVAGVAVGATWMLLRRRAEA